MPIMNALDEAVASGLDLDLLRVLDALLRERHVTRAAARLGASQSAVSHALGRLRRAFGDELFVRTPHGMLPTPRAAQLAPRLARLVSELAELTAHPAVFEPRKLARNFVLASGDYAEIVLLPPLVHRIAREAPEVNLVMRQPVADLDAALEAGHADVALGVFDKLSPRLVRQRLFADHFVCLLRANHPVLSAARTLSPRRFAELGHVLISLRGDPTGVVDTSLAKLGLKRRVAVCVTSFAAAPMLVARSEMALMLPSRIAAAMPPGLPVTAIAPPVPIPGFSVYQVWHERQHHDPAHAWLRSTLAAVAAESLQPVVSVERAPTRGATTRTRARGTQGRHRRG